MSRLLVVQPDAVQADVLATALRAYISEDVAVAESLEEALSWIEGRLPDAILLPTLIPEIEDHLLAYLATIPGAGHVQILGLPPLHVHTVSVPQPVPSRFPWRRKPPARDAGPAGCAADVFAHDVATYLEQARALKQEIEFDSGHTAKHAQSERRRERRFARHEVPWISTIRIGGEQADLIDVSSRAVRLRTISRPARQLLARSDSTARHRPHLVVELESNREVLAAGRVIRCVVVQTHERTAYEVTFSFDAAVGLHLPAVHAITTKSVHAEGRLFLSASFDDRA